MDLGLANKVAIVTGSGRGIGRAIALRLAAEGAAVVVNDTPGNPSAEETAHSICACGGRAVALTADVGEYAQVQQMLKEAIAHFGQIDILVNNAGIVSRKGILDVPLEEWDRVLRTNLNGAFYASRLVAMQMIERGIHGRIVNISSIHGQAAKSHMGSYSASKGAINMLTRQLAVELAPAQIGVNGIAVGAVRTEINEPLYQSTAPEDVILQNAVKRRIPLGFIGDPEDVAAAVCFLASATQARYICGEILYVDGGYIADGTARP